MEVSETSPGESPTSEPDRACKRCEVVKPAVAFRPHKDCRGGRVKTCRTCYHATARLWNERNSERFKEIGREGSYRRRYGLTVEQFERMSEEQGHACAICDKPCATYSRLSIDHDHRTMAIRGALCHSCNRGLGHFKDNQDSLVRAAIYLNAARRRHKKETLAGS